MDIGPRSTLFPDREPLSFYRVYPRKEFVQTESKCQTPQRWQIYNWANECATKGKTRIAQKVPRMDKGVKCWIVPSKFPCKYRVRERHTLCWSIHLSPKKTFPPRISTWVFRGYLSESMELHCSEICFCWLNWRDNPTKLTLSPLETNPSPVAERQSDLILVTRSQWLVDPARLHSQAARA